VLLDDMTNTNHDLQVQSVVHGVIRLEQLNPEYGAERRRLHRLKYRGVAIARRLHDYVIRKGGPRVYPRLVAREHDTAPPTGWLPSGDDAIDELLGGGLERGSSTLIVGAAGTGKSSLATQFAVEAARRGEHAAMFIFDESLATLQRRAQGLGIALTDHLAMAASPYSRSIPPSSRPASSRIASCVASRAVRHASSSSTASTAT
jgi:circadian clock protein KaiC